MAIPERQATIRGSEPPNVQDMSNAPQGPEWWLASDGRWYPPKGAKLPAPPARRSVLLWFTFGFCGLLAAWLLVVSVTQPEYQANSARVVVALLFGVISTVSLVVNLNRRR